MDPLKRLETDAVSQAMLNGIELLRILDREVPAQVLSCFLYIAAHNPCHKQAIEEDLGFTTASASRNIDMLCEKNRLKKPGFGLVWKEHDPSNRRRLMCGLTSKGEALLRQLKDLIYGPIENMATSHGVHIQNTPLMETRQWIKDSTNQL